MKNKRFILKIFLGIFLLCLKLDAQLSTQEIPISFKYNFNIEQISKVVIPDIDIIKLQAEDEKEEELGIPPRFGFIHSVDLNLLDAGYWHTLDNGDKLCQLIIACPGALSINLLYDKFWLPSGTKFFIYSKNKQHHIGAFTEINNKGSKDAIEGFATGLVYGDTTILEYYLPKDCKEKAIISIVGVVHGYRYILPEYGYGNVPGLGFNQSDKCHININCPEGNNWQNEKRAVALILVNGNRNCTGSLINNTSNDYYPYFLTADHCLGGYDAINSPNLNHWTFYWNYELPNCSGNTAPQAFSTSGAKVLANNSSSDFALLKLDENPVSLYNYSPSYRPYYLGWDRTGNAGTGGVGIHHPQGDVKKISTSIQTQNHPNQISWLGGPVTPPNTHWSSTFSNGLIEGGSSGSPLINSTHRVIGQLHGGLAAKCNTNYNMYYGKFNISWTGNNATDSRRRLSNWLEPNNTGVTTLDGIDYSPYCATTTVTGTQTTKKVVCDEIIVKDATIPSGVSLELQAGSVKINGTFKVAGASLIIR